MFVGDVDECNLAFQVVAHQRGEREGGDEECNDILPEGDQGADCILNIGNAIGDIGKIFHKQSTIRTGNIVAAGDEDAERGDGANTERIDEHGKSLNEALFNGVVSVDRSGSRGTGALAGLVGVNAASHAPDQCSSDHAAKHGLGIERGRENQADHAGKLRDVGCNQNDGDEEIYDTHDRNNLTSRISDALDAAKNDRSQDNRDRKANRPHRDVERGGN